MSTQKNEQLPCPFMLSATVCHECGNPNKCDVYNESSRIAHPTDTTGSGREGETPETDLAIYQKSQHGQTVMADFARQLERRLNEEKRRRINYQTIVYDVCNLLDRANGKKPSNGIVCGTGDSPTKQTQEAVTRLIAERDAAMNDLHYRDEATEANRKYVEKCNHLPSLVIQSENGPICCECWAIEEKARADRWQALLEANNDLMPTGNNFYFCVEEFFRQVRGMWNEQMDVLRNCGTAIMKAESERDAALAQVEALRRDGERLASQYSDMRASLNEIANNNNYKSGGKFFYLSRLLEFAAQASAAVVADASFEDTARLEFVIQFIQKHGLKGLGDAIVEIYKASDVREFGREAIDKLRAAIDSAQRQEGM